MPMAASSPPCAPSTRLQPLLPALPNQAAWPLHDVAATRRIEQAALRASAPHALMQRAGLAVARLAAALAPHAHSVWLLAGPGNNGGDAMVAARHLQQWGRTVHVSLLAVPDQLPDDARDAFAQMQAAGVPWRPDLQVPDGASLCIDGLLGIGARRAPEGRLAQAIAQLNALPTPVLAIDLPSGLDADTGQPLGETALRAQHTLALLTLKPGLFTGAGRDHAGRVWLDSLDLPLEQAQATAWLGAAAWPSPRQHVQHKGSFGDVLVLGGAPGMGGAAVLAARAALAAGAGRVLLARLDGGNLEPDPLRPELMPRTPSQVLQPELLAASTVVCGCGGGEAVAATLPLVLAHAGRLVLDADALNALAAEPALWPALRQRTGPTVLTPHPLEAARLLGCSTTEVQRQRLRAAQDLAERSQAVVLLKGSGTVLAAPGLALVINPSGHARLGTAGAGDVLAGWLGAWLANPTAWPLPPLAGSVDPALRQVYGAACAAAWWHGHAGEAGPAGLPLRAADLIDDIAAAVAAADAVYTPGTEA